MPPWGLLCAVLTAPVITRGSLARGSALVADAASAWAALEAAYTEITGTPPAPQGRPLILGRAVALPRRHAATSQQGRILVRGPDDGAVTAAMRLAVRHEVAHQLLW